MISKLDLLSDDEFKDLIKNSSCTSDVLRSLGYSVKGNSWGFSIIRERMNKLNVDFGKIHLESSHSNRPLTLDQVLTKESGYNRAKLKVRLIEAGLKEYKCECCGITEWNNKPISLQLHHINGINNDNRLENLQLLCPNCHSQTENFGTKGKGTVIRRKADNLPLEVRKEIMETVREYGIVEARKRLTYRNSIINYVVKQNKDKIIMHDPQNSNEWEFNTVQEAANFICEYLNLTSNPANVRSNISNCLRGAQHTVQGYTFTRRSVDL